MNDKLKHLYNERNIIRKRESKNAKTTTIRIYTKNAWTQNSLKIISVVEEDQSQNVE